MCSSRLAGFLLIICFQGKTSRCARAYHTAGSVLDAEDPHFAWQVPLQPLQDNLESQTYEVFEKDVTKYTQYEEAILTALQTLKRRSSAAEASTTATDTKESLQPNGHHRSTAPSNGAEAPVVIFVVGAGRGPLVRASILAGQRAGRAVRVYAVEKNPNAVITLHRLVASQRCADLALLCGLYCIGQPACSMQRAIARSLRTSTDPSVAETGQALMMSGKLHSCGYPTTATSVLL